MNIPSLAPYESRSHLPILYVVCRSAVYFEVTPELPPNRARYFCPLFFCVCGRARAPSILIGPGPDCVSACPQTGYYELLCWLTGYDGGFHLDLRPRCVCVPCTIPALAWVHPLFHVFYTFPFSWCYILCQIPVSAVLVRIFILRVARVWSPSCKAACGVEAVARGFQIACNSMCCAMGPVYALAVLWRSPNGLCHPPFVLDTLRFVCLLTTLNCPWFARVLATPLPILLHFYPIPFLLKLSCFVWRFRDCHLLRVSLFNFAVRCDHVSCDPFHYSIYHPFHHPLCF
jgi:hypothetical protein